MTVATGDIAMDEMDDGPEVGEMLNIVALDCVSLAVHY